MLGIRDGHLSARPLSSNERKPIDVFFSELAEDRGERSVGVVLSGGDADGTLGLKAIKEAGGLTLAQGHGAFGPYHPDMPEAASASGFVDVVVPAMEMGAKILELVALDERFRELADHEETDEASPGSAYVDALPEIYALLRSQVGHDFSGYKTRTFIRRVQRRMQIRQCEEVRTYLDILNREPEEVGMLFRDLLINVTSFFRDDSAFRSLAELVIPKLMESRSRDDTVRIWVPGCATGEEVYSIAILVREQLDGMPVPPRVQIFATDIDDRALAVARVGRYPEALLESITEARRERFFVGDGPSRVVAKEIRDLCIFSPHSLIKDPPFSRIDLVSCRNLLIYFGPEVQARVMPTFHYALKTDGYLFLGSAENVTQYEDLFAPVDKHHRIFRRRSVRTPTLQLPSLPSGRGNEASPRRIPASMAEFRAAVDTHVLERFAPAHVIINSDGDIVFFSTRTGKYLEMPSGTPTRHLLTLARRDLRLELRTMLREALESGRGAHREGVVVEMEDGRVQLVSLTMNPFPDRAGGEPLYVLIFNDQGPMLTREEAIDRLQANQDGASLQTERELRETKERLQSLIEEYETALEELKSSNEELVSVNEELQSTNEELEASKEELQSVNEELHTVNNELNGKVDALDRANSDLVNLFEATDIATVFLDGELVIRSFTPAVRDVLNIREGDVGRPVTDLSSRINLEGLGEDLVTVMRTGQRLERRAEGAVAKHYLVRIAPYIDGSRKPEGVIVTFLDVTSIAQFERRQQMLLSELQHRTRNLLGVVQAIAMKSLPESASLLDFFQRLEAIGRTQRLVGLASAESLKLADILQQEFDAMPETQGRVTVSGPDVALPLNSAQTIALALHELATNALKYGAFHTPGGHVDVKWELSGGPDDETITLIWRESGGVIAEQPARVGFGRELIEKALAHTLRARTQLTFEKDGVLCVISIPQLRST